MGREIRRVPKGWEHPKRDNGSYHPMRDASYEEAANEWLNNCILFSQGKHPYQLENKYNANEYKYWWDFDGTPPEIDYYLPTWKPEERICYQIYENVSEGTPVSPVFESEEEMVQWLIKQGHSENASRKFVEDGWVMTGMLVDGRSAMNIDCFDLIRK